MNMKRITIIAATLAVVLSAHGQERKWHLESEVGFNVTHYFNYPALSALQDDTEGYTGLTSAFNFGLRHGNHAYYGLRYENTNVFTGNLTLDERAVVHNLSLVIRHSAMLTESLELQFGATLGLAILHNTFAYGGQNHSLNRYGFSGSLDVGLRYYVGESFFFSFNAGVGGINGLSEVLNLPAGLQPQTRGSANSAHIGGGIGFGFRPKVKKLNMPAEVIDRKEPLQMAWYGEEW